MNIPQEIIDKIKSKSHDYCEGWRDIQLSPQCIYGIYMAGSYFGYSLRDDEVAELKKQNENLLLVAQSALKKSIQSKGFVWDYSDIAIKFKHWSNGIKFENENAAFSEFFEEVYNRDFINLKR